MARVLPLYKGRPRLHVECVHPLEINQDCKMCGLSDHCRSACIAPEWTGESGGLLVVSDYPGQKEDNLGRPFVGPTGQYLRPVLKRLWDGPIALDNAVKCRPKSNMPPNAVSACQSYLATTIAEAKPSKVLAMGSTAIRALTDRSPGPLSVRRGYGWLPIGDDVVPVYLFPNPVIAVNNRFLRRWVEEDLEWALSTDPPFPPAWDGVVKVVECLDDALQAEQEIREAGGFSFDIESAGKMWFAFQVVTISLAAHGSDDAWAWSDLALADPECLRVLERLLSDPMLGKGGSNTKYDELGCLADLKIRTQGVTDDIRLLRRLMDSGASGYLEDMAELVGMGGHKSEAQRALVSASKVVLKIAKENVSGQLTLFGGGGGLRADVRALIRPGEPTKAYAYGLMPRDVCIRYNAMDSVGTGRLRTLLRARLAADDGYLTETYTQTVMPAAAAVRQMEEWGVLVDRDSIGHFHRHLETQKAAVKVKLTAGAWEGFNANAYDDVRKLLFEQLKLPIVKETDKGKESTEAAALEEIRHLHPMVQLILDWRSVAKMDSNYAAGLLPHIRNDGRIHANMKLDGAATGRPSCTEPNLYTTPRAGDSPEGKMARDCFVAPLGHKLVSLDYSQIELRVAAMLSGDQEMIKLFKDGQDFHQATADLVWGLNSDKRSSAKAVNFGLLYGMTDSSLAAKLGCSKKEAGETREAILGKFSTLAKWIKAQLVDAKRTGYCWVWWDGKKSRRRSLHKLASKDSLERFTAKNGAHNTPVQGSASEYMTKSLAQVVDWVVGDGIPAKVMMALYDSIIAEVRDDAIGEYMDTTVAIMTGWNSFGVPLVVDAEVGQAWGSLTKHKMAA